MQLILGEIGLYNVNFVFDG